MKNSIPIIILSILLTVSMAVAYSFYNKNLATQEALEFQQKTNEEISTSYNRARALITDKDITINVLDKKLKKELGRKPKIIEKTVIKIISSSKGQGKATTSSSNTDAVTAVTEDNRVITINRVYEFKDFRLSATLDTWTSNFIYSLSQLFDIQVIQLQGDDYRVQVLELNKDTKDVVQKIEVKDFNVVKLRKGKKQINFGANLNVGAGVFIGPDGKKNIMAPPYPDLYGTLNFISYGRTHLDSDWRFLSIGAGSKQALIVPVSWNLGNVIQLLSDAWIDLSIGVNWDGKLTGGLGLSSTF